jgi:hypothetical protein
MSNKLTGFLQPEQKSSRHVGQCTAQAVWSADDDDGRNETVFAEVLGPTKHMVSQPAFGHHVRNLSSSTSENKERNKCISNATKKYVDEKIGYP